MITYTLRPSHPFAYRISRFVSLGSFNQCFSRLIQPMFLSAYSTSVSLGLFNHYFSRLIQPLFLSAYSTIISLGLFNQLFLSAHSTIVSLGLFNNCFSRLVQPMFLSADSTNDSLGLFNQFTNLITCAHFVHFPSSETLLAHVGVLPSAPLLLPRGPHRLTTAIKRDIITEYIYP